MLEQILLVCYLLVSIAIIGLVLIQQGKGAGMGASFGAGASATLFGSGGSGNFLTRSTAVLATVFFVLSLMLGRLGAEGEVQGGSFDSIDTPAAEVSETPAPAQPESSDVPN